MPIIAVFLLLGFISLGYKLFDLTILKGDYYRDLSDNKKIKEVDELASRGNIYDKNGKILATSIPSFCIKLYKDEVLSLDENEKTKDLVALTNIIEDDGINYDRNFAITLNAFVYDNAKDYFTDKENSPTEKVIDLIIKNQLVDDLLDRVYEDSKIHYCFATTALYALRNKGIDLPIEVSKNANSAEFQFRKNASLDKNLEKYGFNQNDDPKTIIVQNISNDRSLLRNIMDNPLARRITYDLLKERNLSENIQLQQYAFTKQLQLVQKKSALSHSYKSINENSTAKEDFLAIVNETSGKELLKMASLSDDGSYIIPADLIIEELEKKEIYANFETKVKTTTKDEKNEYEVDIQFKNPQTGDPAEELLNLAKQNNVLNKVVVDDNVKFLAQKANTKLQVYPSIDVENWLYTYQKEEEDIIDKYKLYIKNLNDKNDKSDKKTKRLVLDAKQSLERIKEINEVNEENDYLSNGMISILHALYSQGSYAYRPLNLAYNISENTVARIEENIGKNKGIYVETVPIRYYPNRNMLSHVLGYMGNIATENEIAYFIKKKNYLQDEFIGKTGIEESYEDSLRGKNGKKIVTVDSRGNRKETLSEVKSSPGQDLYLTIDSDLQKIAEDSLNNVLRAIRDGAEYENENGFFKPERAASHAQSGAVVVSDIKTGEVLALTSFPNYDPNLFSTGISSSDWEALEVSDDKDPLAPRPLLNNASQTAVMPGSTFKLVSTYAALEKGLDPQQINTCYGYMDVGDSRFQCEIYTTKGGTRGEENLYDALRVSCNYYFYTLAMGKNPRDGNDMHVKLELNDLRKAALDLGLGEITGIEIDIPQENKGNIPSAGKKLEVTKVLLGKYLEKNLSSYLKKDVNKSKKELKKDIDIIVSWCDGSKDKQRGEIIKELDEMGYEPEEIRENQIAGLADNIKYSYLNQAAWDIGDMLNIVIGQGQNSYTPLQLNRMISAISNGGYLNKYTLINSIKEHNSNKLIFDNQPERKKINVTNDEYLENIKYGALQAAQANAVLKQLPIDIGVKTGTAEVEGYNTNGDKYDTFAWMIGFAPYDNPEIAVSILLTQGDTSMNCSPIMRDVVAGYLKLKSKN